MDDWEQVVRATALGVVWVWCAPAMVVFAQSRQYGLVFFTWVTVGYLSWVLWPSREG